jgi:hypothetical protein
MTHFIKVPYDLGYAEAICERCRLKLEGRPPESLKTSLEQFEVEDPEQAKPKAKMWWQFGKQKSKFD